MPNEWFKGRNCLVPRLLCPIPYLAVFSAQLFSPFSRSWLCFTHNIYIFFLLFFLHFILYKHTEAFRSIFSYFNSIFGNVLYYHKEPSPLNCPSRVKLKSIFYFTIITHVFLCICDYYLFHYKMLFKVVYIVESLFNHFLYFSLYLSFFTLGPVEFIF